MKPSYGLTPSLPDLSCYSRDAISPPTQALSQLLRWAALYYWPIPTHIDRDNRTTASDVLDACDGYDFDGADFRGGKADAWGEAAPLIPQHLEPGAFVAPHSGWDLLAPVFPSRVRLHFTVLCGLGWRSAPVAPGWLMDEPEESDPPAKRGTARYRKCVLFHGNLAALHYLLCASFVESGDAHHVHFETIDAMGPDNLTGLPAYTLGLGS